LVEPLPKLILLKPLEPELAAELAPCAEAIVCRQATIPIAKKNRFMLFSPRRPDRDKLIIDDSDLLLNYILAMKRK
jgi:hypothetical protein